MKVGYCDIGVESAKAGKPLAVGQDHFAQFIDCFVLRLALFLVERFQLVENLTEFTGRIDRDLVSDGDPEQITFPRSEQPALAPRLRARANAY